MLLRNSKILEAAVIGVKHEEYGEVPRAYVVVKQGFEMTEEEVQNIIKQKMSSYKHLKGGVRFLPSLPKNNSGKIARKELEKLD